MYAEFKITNWERVRVPSEIEDEVMEKIKSGEIESSNELLEEYPECTFEGEMEDCVADQMSLEANGGFSTIEVRKAKGELVSWGNGK